MAISSIEANRSIERLLIHFLNTRRDPGQLALAVALVEESQFSWEGVLHVARTERVAPLLYHVTRGSDLVPEWFRNDCRADYLETGAINSLRLRELGAILHAFQHHRIDAIALKGTALVEAIYKNLGLRPMLDIDLLIRQADIEKSIALMETLGYQRQGLEITPGSTMAFENEVSLSKRDRIDWHVELHWGLFDSPFYQEQPADSILWRSAYSARIGDAPARLLVPELLLLHLCGHLFLHHHGKGLLWWNDVAEVLDCCQAQIDWNHLLEAAQTMNLVLPLQGVLPVVVNKWLAPIPAEVLDRLNSLAPSSEEARVFEALTAAQQSPVRRLLADLQSMPNWAGRLRFIYHNLFPSSTYMDRRYGINHPVLRPVYYLYRWLKGISQLRLGRNL